MRKNAVGLPVQQLLDNCDLKHAYQQFRQDCELKETCEFSCNVDNCVLMCLLPKLMYNSLGKTDLMLEARVNNIRQDQYMSAQVTGLEASGS